MDDRRLYRSNTDRAIFGVCGGIAEYFALDSLIIRLLFVLASLGACGSGILLYFIAALLIPLRPEESGWAGAEGGWESRSTGAYSFGEDSVHDYSFQSGSTDDPDLAARQDRSRKVGSKAMGTVGIALLAIGIMWILQRFFKNLPTFALVMIIVGCYILFTKDK